METGRFGDVSLAKARDFLNHFPARGWKQQRVERASLGVVQLFKSFPRKGMETRMSSLKAPRTQTLFKSFPRKGMETCDSLLSARRERLQLFKSFPRKGMETAGLPFTSTFKNTEAF